MREGRGHHNVFKLNVMPLTFLMNLGHQEQVKVWMILLYLVEGVLYRNTIEASLVPSLEVKSRRWTREMKITRGGAAVNSSTEPDFPICSCLIVLA